MKAVWNEKIIAESNQTIVIEGNYYFPPESVNKEFLIDSDTHTTCHWKGVASYYHISIDGKVNKDAAWFYPEISEMAKGIKGYLAFWKGIEIVK
jgi:uncharacterized protein (DUF427 family)